MRPGLLIFALSGALVLAGLAAAGWLYRAELAALAPSSATPSPQSRPAPRPDPLARVGPDMTARLTRPTRDVALSFQRIPWVTPKAFCKAFEAMGLKNAVFAQGEIGMRGWTCFSDLLKPVEGDEAAVSSLFVSARGPSGNQLELIRVKLNMLDPATAPRVKAVAKDVLSKMLRGLGWQPPQQMFTMIDELKDVRFVDRGVTFDLKREFGTDKRLNLIVTFPQRLSPGGDDRFIPAPRPSFVQPASGPR